MLYACILKIMKRIETIIRLQMCKNTPINYYKIHQKKMFFYSIQWNKKNKGIKRISMIRRISNDY
jgi:hypothetical protein